MNLPFKDTDKVLECGGGNVPLFRPNCDVRAGDNIDIVADFNKPLPFKDGEWNGVFCKFALEHVSWRSVRSFIKEIYRILAPGGQAVFITANLLEQARMIVDAPHLADDHVGMIFGDNDYTENSHRTGFSPQSAGQIFKEVGFDRVITSVWPAVINGKPWKGDMVIEVRKEDYDPKKQFDKHYFHGTKHYDAYRDYPQNWTVFNKLMEHKPTSILDIGCGRGYIVKRFQDAGILAAGIDISKHCFLTRVCNNFIGWDVCNVPWPVGDKYFDLCFSSSLLELIPEDKLPIVLAEIERVSHRGLHASSLDGFMTKETLESGFIFDNLPAGDNKVKCNLGSFTNMFHHGWINIDILGLDDFAIQNGYKFYQQDITKGLPFSDSSVDLIYSSHMLEHFTYDEAIAFLKECRRVMKPDSTMRLLVPSTELLINKYQNKDMNYFSEISDDVEKGWGQAGKFWSIMFSGHKAAYDFATVELLAKEAGLRAEEKSFYKGHPQIIAETIDMLPELSLIVELTLN